MNCGGNSSGCQARRKSSYAPGLSLRLDRKQSISLSSRRVRVWAVRLSPAVEAGDERRWIVPLPPAAQPPYRVFVNGGPQEGGIHSELRGRALAFPRPLAGAGPRGLWRG